MYRLESLFINFINKLVISTELNNNNYNLIFNWLIKIINYILIKIITDMTKLAKVIFEIIYNIIIYVI